MVTTIKAPAQWLLDPSHSSVEFAVKHMVISTVRGRFAKYSADIHFDEAQPHNSVVEATVDLASVDTREPRRDDHLRSADFFDVQNHPTMHFKSRSITPQGRGQYKVVGNLTIRGITREVALDAAYSGIAKDPWGSLRAGFSLEGSVNRKDFGLVWNQALEAGGVLVGDTIKIAIDGEIVKQQAA